MRAEGWHIIGPLPADTMFHEGARSQYDAALCMYHDQALIPLKALHFDEGVNITLGLPIVRTAPDHGTAFDIAGEDRADPRAMAAAIRMAAQCAAYRALAAMSAGAASRCATSSPATACRRPRRSGRISSSTASCWRASPPFPARSTAPPFMKSAPAPAD